MANAENYSIRKAIKRFNQLVNLEKREISNVYFYAIINGFILLSLPLGIQAIVNLLFGGTISTSLIVLIGVVIAGVLFTGILQIAQMRITERLQQKIFTRLTFAYAYRIPKLNLLSVDSYYLPELVNRFFDTANLQKGFSKLLLDFPAASIQIIFGLTLLCFYHPVFIIFAITIFTLVIIIFYFSSDKGFVTSMKESDYKYDVAHWLEEISRAVKPFKLNRHHELHLKRTDKLVNGYLTSRDQHFSVLLFQYRILTAFKVVTTAAMLILGSYLFIEQQINLGQFIAAEIVIITILSSIEKMILSLEVVYDVLTALEKLNKVLAKPQDDEVSDEKSLAFATSNGLNLKMTSLDFAYPHESLTLKNINLEIKSGEKVCIIGSEGSGKSTLLRILSGIYQDFKGNILYNNTPLKMIDTRTLNRNVSSLLGDEDVFSGSIFDNITLGNPEISFADLDLVCKIVGLDDYISKQQQGYDTYVDPQGKKLPFNIIQKILLARCLVTKPALILVEDNWNGIEPQIRQQVINYLTNPDHEFTLVAISNDETFKNQCERIIYLENGQLVEN
ncbi:ATP-binding cassette domain-containing protein [Pedobacter aquae]|uniref:ATP-binding cassette domain-containing protein n=1 Tax=Pedobacter aquae TaxID=2605747 RepID=A0A5C0VH47_9SPHI|nr:ATP-binding cassette domain-containing protein [Pedobacter aquae]QEK50951.1 ATP-binding cassette domain-containing protein [Pedobacter aquae]